MGAATTPLRSLGQGFLDLVFAPVCLGCSRRISTAAADRLVCVACWARGRPVPEPRCPRCWSPLVPAAGAFSPCGTCPALPASLRVVRAALVMEEPARSLVHALKYGGWRAIAGPLGILMAALPVPVDVDEEVCTVVPVPLGAARMRQRGYNQAELLARALAPRRGWTVDAGALLRTRTAGTQTTLHPAERRANVSGAFAVPPAARDRLAGRHLLLVDDVWTTGATVLACVDALVGAGARAVSAFTLVRALPELRRLAKAAAGP